MSGLLVLYLYYLVFEPFGICCCGSLVFEKVRFGLTKLLNHCAAFKTKLVEMLKRQLYVLSAFYIRERPVFVGFIPFVYQVFYLNPSAYAVVAQ